jgi:hypothetical protein
MQHLQSNGTALFDLTEHARTRAQRRGIHPDELDALLTYGRRIHDHLDGLIYTFDEEGLNQLRQDAPRTLWKRLQSHRSIYVVTNADGRVITTGHRYKRLVRDRSQTAHRTSYARKKSSNRPDLFPDAPSWFM